MAPAGYFLDYSNNKIDWVIWASFATSALTVLTALTARPGGENIGLMILWMFLQGGITAILPPGFNGITLGIVGSTGFTHQVSRNRMMNHIGTALVVAIGSLIAYLLYPNIGALFVVSPLATIGMYYNLVRIKPTHVDRDAARCLIIDSPTMTEYDHLDGQASVDQMHGMEDDCDDSDNNRSSPGEDDMFSDPSSAEASSYMPPGILAKPLGADSTAWLQNSNDPSIANNNSSNGSGGQVSNLTHPKTSHPEHFARDWYNPSNVLVRSYASKPSFKFGWGGGKEGMPKEVPSKSAILRARTPLAVLLDPTLVTFTLVVFFFHLANSSVLPLVMQSLALQDPQAGILLSGLCILIAQAFMSYFAKICGDYSPKWGRKGLIILGISSLTLRCFLLTVLLTAQEQVETESQSNIVKALILSTQILDSVGAGIFGTLHILVTNDISCRTGRFSLMLGVTTGAMCLGATVSGYIGQAIAQDHGYPVAFASLGVISLIPLFIYMLCMPETLPDYAKPKQRRRRLMALLKRLNEQRRKLAVRANPFRRRREGQGDAITEELDPKSDDKKDQHGTKGNSKNLELV
jgi:MFS family permease